MNKTLALASVLFTVGAFSGAAQAGPVMCTGGTATYTGTDPDATVNVSDVTLDGSNADDCFYDVTSGASNDAAEEGIINSTDMRNTQISAKTRQRNFVDIIHLPLARRGFMEETAVGSPDLRILVLLRLLMSYKLTMASCRITPRLQWRHRAGFTPASPSQPFIFL